MKVKEICYAKWRWIRKVLWGTSPDKSRLAGDIYYYQKRLELEQVDHENEATWVEHAKDLLGKAKEALDDDNNDLSWRYLDAARSFLFLGSDDENLRAGAQAINNEAEDQSKNVTQWRRKTIQDYLCHEGKIKQDLDGWDLCNASAILYENHHNNYNKLTRIKRELVLLAAVAATTVVVWLIIAPQLCEYDSIDNRTVIFSVVLYGIMGASVSGILTVASGGVEARIPEQLIDFWVLLVKLVVGAVSALAIFAFLFSGFLSFEPTTVAQVLAVSFVAGFSERLVTSAVESVPTK
ncbi:MAG TPA: hypothetical protein PKL29_04630 [Methanothrix sp.]|nr:hypothetical protein [Methanothrix sp.]